MDFYGLKRTCFPCDCLIDANNVKELTGWKM